MTYALHLFVTLGIYLMLAFSANLLIGYGGLLTLAQAAFFGLGAYLFAVFSVTLGWPTAVAAFGTVAGCGLAGCVFAVVLRRFRGETFAVATVALQMIAFGVYLNWTDVTGGSYGFPDIPRLSAFGFAADAPVAFAVCTAVCVAGMVLVLRRFSQSVSALSLRALRDDENVAASLGHSPERMRMFAIVLSALLASVPGILFASYVAYVDPTGFSISESVFILSMLVVGGSGNLSGPAAGAAFMVLVPELLRFLGVPDAVAGSAREIVYGLLLIVFMYYRPRGICGDFAVR